VRVGGTGVGGREKRIGGVVVGWVWRTARSGVGKRESDVAFAFVVGDGVRSMAR